MICYMAILTYEKKHLQRLYAKLKQDSDLLANYNGIFIAQKEYGVIEKAPDSCEVGEGHYLPHQLVVN